MKKSIRILFIFLLGHQLYLFASQEVVGLQVSPVNSRVIRLAISVLEDNLFADVYGDMQSMTFEFSDSWMNDFRRKRTKELALMREELLVFRSMLYNASYCRTEEQRKNIERFIECYEGWIPQREREEQLNNIQFFHLYGNKSSQLIDDISNTRARLSGIRY